METLKARYVRLLDALGRDKRSAALVAAVLQYGQIERGDAGFVLKTSNRTARNVLSELVRDFTAQLHLKARENGRRASFRFFSADGA